MAAQRLYKPHRRRAPGVVMQIDTGECVVEWLIAYTDDPAWPISVLTS